MPKKFALKGEGHLLKLVTEPLGTNKIFDIIYK
jgi:hypothetical protein